MSKDLQRAFRRAALLICCALGTLLPASLLPGPAAAASEAERDAVFARLLQAPDDRGLMLDYARMSVALRDYEAAISTLQRMLAQTPEDAETRYELAIAYYALGANQLAAYHFGILQSASGALPADRQAELAAYAARAEAAQTGSRIDGRVSVGAAREGGRTGTAAEIGLTWRLDLGTAGPAFWQTDIAGFALRIPGDAGRNQRGFLFRTGPFLSLDGTAYGPQLRPYLELRRDLDLVGEDRSDAVLGLQFRTTHSPQWSSFADLRHGRARLRDLDISGRETELALGATWRPSRDTRLRFGTRLRRERSTEGVTRRWTGWRADAAQEFRPPLVAVPRNWVVSAHLQSDRIAWRDGSGLTEWRDSAGIGLRAFVTRTAFVDLSYRTLRRRSDDPARERRRNLAGLQIGMEF